MYSQNRKQLRDLYYQSWHKYQQQLPLSALEQQIVAVIADHPEYHFLFTQENTDKDFSVNEANPFLHLSLHLSVRDQLHLDKPTGIKALFEKLQAQHQDRHQAEHLLMETLANLLWQAQSNQQAADETIYLQQVAALLEK